MKKLTITVVSLAIAAGSIASVDAAPPVVETQEWGSNWFGQFGNGRAVYETSKPSSSIRQPVTDVSGGRFHTLWLSGGTVFAAGDNQYGQLGDGTTTWRPTAAPVLGLAGVTQISAGQFESIALRADGSVWAWGRGFGRIPTQIQGLSSAVNIDAGSTHSSAVRSDGTVWGFRDTTPWMVDGLSEVTDVAVRDSDFAMKRDGTVWSWYSGPEGTTVPTQVQGLDGVVRIETGYWHTLAIKSDGTVWAWGVNWDGQLGDGTKQYRSAPVQVKDLTGICDIDGGEWHSIALGSDGSVWTWGSNMFGQLGIVPMGFFQSRSIPVRANTLPAVAISAGYYHSLSLASRTPGVTCSLI